MLKKTGAPEKAQAKVSELEIEPQESGEVETDEESRPAGSNTIPENK